MPLGYDGALFLLDPMVRFLVIFSVLLAGLFIAELTPPAQEWVVQPWTNFVAYLSGIIARWIDPNTIVTGATLMDPVSRFGVTIVAGCNGVEATIMLLAAMVAFPASFVAKAVGIVVGTIAVQGLNLVRVVSLYFIGRWSMPAFEFAHLYAWQVLILLDVLIVWLLWLRALPAKKDARG